MRKRSAGLLLFKRDDGELRVFLVHPGGPFWKKRDQGSWSIPKGEYLDGEEARAVAVREFEEETGIAPPAGELIALGEVRQPAGKSSPPGRSTAISMRKKSSATHSR